MFYDMNRTKKIRGSNYDCWNNVYLYFYLWKIIQKSVLTKALRRLCVFMVTTRSFVTQKEKTFLSFNLFIFWTALVLYLESTISFNNVNVACECPRVSWAGVQTKNIEKNRRRLIWVLDTCSESVSFQAPMKCLCYWGSDACLLH